ncbi:hypothetical protein ACWGJX_46880 [Streptomyces sp. NPDC054775]
MPENTTTAAGVSSQYAAQVTSDLEYNVKEQERISAEIAALQEQLASLHQDHSVLVNVQQALGTVPAFVQPAAALEGSVVPAPREKATTEPGNSKRARTKKEAAGSAATKPVPKKPVSRATETKTSQPTLVELVRHHLTEQSEPRSAAEVATALDTAHPKRGVKATVVRTTLENLVAKNQAQRTKQGSSVYYTAPSPAGHTAAPTQDEQKSE